MGVKEEKMRKLRQFLFALVAMLAIAALWVILPARGAAAHENRCFNKVSTTVWYGGIDQAAADSRRKIDRERWLRCLAQVRPRMRPWPRVASVRPRPKPQAPGEETRAMMLATTQ